MNSNLIILNKRLFKAIVNNDINDICRLINIGADVNSEFTVNELVTGKLLDENAITIINNSEITVDNIKWSLETPMLYEKEIAAMRKISDSKIIALTTLFNNIILSMETKLTPLQLALFYGWRQVMVELIKRGANPNKALDIQGTTILQLLCTAAVFKNKECYIFDEEIVQLLFDHGADPNIENIIGQNAICYMARRSDFILSENISRMNLEISHVPDYRNSKRIEKFLINGANPNIKDSYNCCTLILNIKNYDKFLDEQPNLTNLLLDHGGNYGTYEDVLRNPETILMMQEDYGRNFGVADAKKLVDSFNSEKRDYIKKNRQLLEAIKNKDCCTPSILLKKGVSPNIRDKDGLSALHLSVKFLNYTITELLLEKCANPNVKSWKKGTTPLFNAVINNRVDLAELLLKHKANPSVLNTNGISPLYFSITNNNTKMTELLLKYKADPDISNQVSGLFNLLNEVKNDDQTELIEKALDKIRKIAKFLKSYSISLDYCLFYNSIDIAEKNNKKNIEKGVFKLLNELT